MTDHKPLAGIKKKTYLTLEILGFKGFEKNSWSIASLSIGFLGKAI